MHFTSKLYLPVLNKEIRYNNITNKYYFEILKFITNNDDNGLNEYFEWLLNELILEKHLYNSLSNIEKFLIFLDVRSLSLGDTLHLNTNLSSKIDVRIAFIKSNLINKLKEHELISSKDYNGYNVDLSIPKSFVIEDIDNIYSQVINKISMDNEVIIFSDLTKFEKESIISSLPAEVSLDILNYINYVADLTKNINIISGNPNIGLESFHLNVFDKSLFYMLKTIFKDDLLNFYELQYFLISKMNVTYSHFMSMTPNECKIYLNFYNKEMKKQEEAQEEANKNYSVPKIR